MPETLTCPECQRKVRLPDHLIGKRVKCPSCGGTFTATPTTMAVPALPTEPEPAVPFEPMPAPVGPVSARPPVEEQEGDLAFPREPEVDIPTADVSAWFGVRTGLKVQVVAHAALAGGLSLLLLLFLIALAVESSRRGSGADIGTFEMILTLLAGLALLTGWILNSVAGCFLLGTPSRRSARGLSVGVLLMNTLILLQLAQVGRLLLVGDLDPGGRTAGIVPALDRRGREAASLAASGFFFFFEVTRLTLMALLLRAMCLNLRQARLGANAQLLVLLTPSIMLGTLALTFLVMIATTPGVAVRTILVFLFLGGWIGVLVFGVIVMLGLKQKLDRKLPSTEPA